MGLISCHVCGLQHDSVRGWLQTCRLGYTPATRWDGETWKLGSLIKLKFTLEVLMTLLYSLKVATQHARKSFVRLTRFCFTLASAGRPASPLARSKSQGENPHHRAEVVLLWQHGNSGKLGIALPFCLFCSFELTKSSCFVGRRYALFLGPIITALTQHKWPKPHVPSIGALRRAWSPVGPREGWHSDDFPWFGMIWVSLKTKLTGNHTF